MLYKAFEETIHAGYDGRSYVNYDNEPGGYIEWNVNVSSSGTYKLISDMQTDQTITDLWK